MERALITDTSVLLNILATEHAENILEDSGWNFSICKAVLGEALVLRNRETQESLPLDLTPHIQSGRLTVCELAGESEYELLVEFASLMGRGGDGEAMSFAIATSRSMPVAIDDQRAVKRARQRFPALTTLTTTDVLMAWQQRHGISATAMGRQLQRIQTWACYYPGQKHPAYEWWKSCLAAA
ncbi:MAG TPA: hypothetical protein VMF06_17660 [Candidatus Limnocylindria bacterium]|jgi:hypothetical protein|nr:hypothetical protein [Candidatus Limnocylindria bacterium]